MEYRRVLTRRIPEITLLSSDTWLYCQMRVRYWETWKTAATRADNLAHYLRVHFTERESEPRSEIFSRVLPFAVSAPTWRRCRRYCEEERKIAARGGSFPREIDTRAELVGIVVGAEKPRIKEDARVIRRKSDCVRRLSPSPLLFLSFFFSPSLGKQICVSSKII